MPMSKDEIYLLIEKLRNKYAEYAEKYSPKWFNIESFEERLRMAFHNKMKLEGFVLAEVTNFEKTKERYDKKKQAPKFSVQVDRIIEENIARITKYPEIQFHKIAGIEIKHFYGALRELVDNYYPILWIIISDPELKNELNNYHEKLSFLAGSRGRYESRRIEEHINVLSRTRVTELEVEKDKNNYLKESAFILHDIINFCDSLIESKCAEWEQPLRFDKLYIENEKKKEVLRIFSNHTGYGAIFKVKDQTLSIVQDFRLEAFKRNNDI